MAMEAAQLYPEVPADSGRSRLEARVAELERIVATLATLRNERLVEPPPVHRAAHRDPVALTAALHPRGLRTTRRTQPRSAANGVLATRIVLFDNPRR